MQEITLSEYQANVLNRVEEYFSSRLYKGETLIQDVYILQKRAVEYILENVAELPINSSTTSLNSEALRVYNNVVGAQATSGISQAAIDNLNPAASIVVEEAQTPTVPTANPGFADTSGLVNPPTPNPTSRQNSTSTPSPTTGNINS